jgi:hypothetical protein
MIKKLCSLVMVFPWCFQLQQQALIGIAERVIGCGFNCREAGSALELGAQSLDDGTKARSLGSG